MIALWALPSGMFARSISRRFGIPYTVWLLGSDVWRAGQLPFARQTLTKVLSDSVGSFADGATLAKEAEAITGVYSEFLPSVRKLPPPERRDSPAYDLLFVGRYHSNKGPDVLLDALALLRGCGRSLKAGLFGSGDLETRLIQKLEDLHLEDTVDIHPPISATHLASALTKAQILVIPSRKESIPMILGDAIQKQTPVVVSNVGDLGDIVRRFDLGEVVEPNRPDLLAAGIAKAVDSSMNVARWEAAQDLFSPSRAAQKLAAPFA